MTFSHSAIDYRDKKEFYRQLSLEAEGLLDRAWFTNLANASSLLMAHLPRLNWAGFYLFEEGELVLGPFQGLPACLRIPLGKGVCGTSAREKRSVRVDDVHLFPGHIACDVRSRSELVVPLFSGDRLLGVMDLDSPEVARFDDDDRAGLEALAVRVVAGTSWPSSFL